MCSIKYFPGRKNSWSQLYSEGQQFVPVRPREQKNWGELLKMPRNRTNSIQEVDPVVSTAPSPLITWVTSLWWLQYVRPIPRRWSSNWNDWRRWGARQFRQETEEHWEFPHGVCDPKTAYVRLWVRLTFSSGEGGLCYETKTRPKV